MMGLFVILWVLKPGPQPNQRQAASEEMKQVLASIREAFGHVPDPDSTDPIDLEILQRKIQRMRPHMGPGEGGETKIKRQGAEGTDPEVTKIRDGKKAGVGGRLLFEPGAAELTPEAKRDLDQIADQIRGHRQIVFIKGHTSLDDFKDDVAPQRQMDLSIRRAQAVADYLTTAKVSPDILRVQGCSTFEPVVQRAYSQNVRTFNRRVEVEVTDTIVEERQDHARSRPDSPLHESEAHTSAGTEAKSADGAH
jgi:outer membrane protein OmpA-like peptidoglycan-associated protein